MPTSYLRNEYNVENNNRIKKSSGNSLSNITELELLYMSKVVNGKFGRSRYLKFKKYTGNLNNSPSRYKVHKIYGQSLITEYRKMGRKNFSFGLALHDKKSKIRISPSRIIDFSIGSSLQGSKG